MIGKGLESLIPNKSGSGEGGMMPEPRVFREEPQPHAHVRPPEVREEPRREPKEKHQVQSVFQIEIEKIQPNPYQPRKEFVESELQELAQSIREFGILQPLIVCKVVREAETGAEVEYQLIAGERRLQAAKLARLERVPALVKQIDAGRAKLEIALIENIQRSNLNPLESAKAYARLQDEFGLTQREIAVRVGKSRESIANAVRLLNLPTEIQDALLKGVLGESQGRALLAIQNPEEQMRRFRDMMQNRTTVRALNRKIADERPEDPKQKFFERQLEERFGAPVKIKHQGKGGAIAIQFYSDEELNGIINRLLESE